MISLIAHQITHRLEAGLTRKIFDSWEHKRQSDYLNDHPHSKFHTPAGRVDNFQSRIRHDERTGAKHFTDLNGKTHTVKHPKDLERHIDRHFALIEKSNAAKKAGKPVSKEDAVRMNDHADALEYLEENWDKAGKHKAPVVPIAKQPAAKPAVKAPAKKKAPAAPAGPTISSLPNDDHGRNDPPIPPTEGNHLEEKIHKILHDPENKAGVHPVTITNHDGRKIKVVLHKRGGEARLTKFGVDGQGSYHQTYKVKGNDLIEDGNRTSSDDDPIGYNALANQLKRDHVAEIHMPGTKYKPLDHKMVKEWAKDAEARLAKASEPLKEYSKYAGPNGLLPEKVRMNPEYRKAKNAYDDALRNLQRMNKLLVKFPEHKKEHKDAVDYATKRTNLRHGTEIRVNGKGPYYVGHTQHEGAMKNGSTYADLWHGSGKHAGTAQFKHGTGLDFEVTGHNPRMERFTKTNKFAADLPSIKKRREETIARQTGKKVDPMVGKEWDHHDIGKQKIVRRIAHPTGDMYETEDSKGAIRRYRADNMEDTIREQHYTTTPAYRQELEERKARLERNKAAEAQREATTAKHHNDIKEFAQANNLSNLQHGKARKALMKLVMHNGQPKSRKEMIEQLHNDGYRFSPSGNRMVKGGSFSFYHGKDLTKTGMDYAKYLAKRGK